MKGWWQKIVRRAGREEEKWFSGNIQRFVGNGREVSFWGEIWVGDSPLKILFPRLFNLSLFKDGKVEGAGKWTEEGWVWEFKWRRELREREKEMEADMRSLIGALSPSPDLKDGWNWKSAAGGTFSTKAAYEECAKSEGEHPGRYIEANTQLWTAPAPNKARVTAWRSICNRLPTCDNLIKRNVPIPVEEKWCNSCVWREETGDHSLIHCTKVDRVWDQIHQWIGIDTATPQRVEDHFRSFIGGRRGKRNKNFLKGLWIGTVWLIWKYGNESRFQNKNWEVSNLVKDIKGRLWSWNKTFHIVESNVSFSMWCSNEYSPLV
ncbi:uncharacterized protein LOC131009826 [Salvia miltiorrhiza]|uniref:uncharacterized protein LOC131009826 n=1 Tax=Salvia miltiorrhiza TaxID=226208 RepID=UPI0025ABD0F4|nr:uncharacterized protein LOC131009826 [Salvia miltiorrhiza]